MEQYLHVLTQSPLFSNMTESEILSVLHCLSAQTKTYRKGTFLFHCGDAANAIGFVLDGCVTILKEDCWGNSTILSQATGGQLFGEVYACLSGETM